ncbi:uncharacterized protein BT62DRAFT_880984 [Guyanagaster necrorhizus]|uniref:Uncharacterized protein n=1 Tax=Guyanagaster necrorhizus TaxID=856835 RepID=A0A9P7W364_9AGAR|nr:uncharacterized protein BT62DRAFT_880984 [Guyanagaster necrorhizus MCA 3950]KAG7451813.1 hypothetical protein BT62DRAFT_880984 [Guyanagaster necrorhizus MCA 3950]
MLRCALFLYLSIVAFANTEISNFYASSAVQAPIIASREWAALSASANQRQYEIVPAPLGTPISAVCPTSPCSHELWLKLDLSSDAWQEFTKFTLRISWAAYNPADFLIDILDGDSITSAKSSDPPTRLKYARIRLVDTGVLTPGKSVDRSTPIPFTVVLEPLYFGVLPASVVPILYFLVPVVLLAALTLPWINAYLESVALKARREIRLSAMGIKQR